MKQIFKYTLTIATLLLVTLGAAAQTPTAKIIYKLDGVVQGESSVPGNVAVDFSTRTITVTPGSGNYLTADDLKAVKIVDGSLATTRNGEPGINTPVTLTAKDANADPSKTTEYTFADLGDNNYGLEVTANFHPRTSISDATVTTNSEPPYVYLGTPIMPEVTVVLGSTTLTKDVDYKVYYQDVTSGTAVLDSINAGSKQIWVDGIGKYIDRATKDYTINKAYPTLTFASESATYTFGQSFTKPVLTTNPEGLTVTYASSNQDVAAVDQTTGDITAKVASAEAITITASFAGNNNYNAKDATYSLTVAKGTAVVTVAPVAKDNLTYTGGDQELVNEGTATNGTMMYRIGTEGDFSADTPKGNAAGQYAVYYMAKATNSDQFNDSEANSITATIKAKSIANATVTLTPESFTFNGENQKPGVSVKDGETDLVLDQDYTLTNVGGTNVGEYTVTVTGKGNYDSETSASKNFNITAKSIANATITLSAESFVYNGQNQKPEVSVKDGDKDLVLDQDYTLTNEGETNVGEYTVTITGKGNYNSQTTASKNYSIKAKSIADATITLTPENFVYNGQNQKPEVSVKDGETDLVLDQDYTLTNEGGTNVGEYTVTVTGKGNYDSETSVSKKYYITVEALEVTAEGYTGTYDGKAHGITVTAPEGATIKYGTVEGTYDLTTNPTYTNAGTYTVYYCVSMANYDDVKGSKNVVIDPKSIADATITLTPESFVYNGENQKPTVSVKDGETDLVLDTDYELTNEGGTNAGEYTVTVTGKGNYDAQTTVSKKYYIIVATMEVTAEGYTGTYDGKAHGITVTAPEGATIKYGTVEGTYDLTANPTYTNAVTYTVYYCVSMANYNDVTGAEAVVIDPKSIANTTITLTPENFTYNGGNQKPTVSVKDGGTDLVLNTDYELTNEGGTNAGEYTVIITGKGNYEPTTKASKNFTIGKATVTLSYSVATAEAKIGEAFTAPTLENPSKVAVAYSSSNTAVAAVDAATGAVTLVAPGSTTITAKFEGSDNYNAAEDRYILSVVKADAVEVELSFGSGTATATYGDATVAVPVLNNPLQLPLVWASGNKDVAIVNASSGDITIVGAGQAIIYASFAGSDVYRAKTIYFTLTVNKYPVSVAFATSSESATLGEDYVSPKATVNPSGLTLVYSSSDESVASVDANTGEVTLVGAGTVMISAMFSGSDNFESDSDYYTLTVENPGSELEPIVKEMLYSLDDDSYFLNVDGSEIDLSNIIINNILFTLKNQSSPEGDGYDTEDHCIVINTVTATSTVNALIENNVEPGSAEYANLFTGLTFLVPAGEGYIIVTSQEADGVYLMVKVGKNDPVAIHQSEMGDYNIPYKSDFQTIVRMWKGDSEAHNYSSTRGRKKMPDVRVSKVTYKAVNTDGIQRVTAEAFKDTRWFDLNGQQISQPVKKGVYIHGNRKVVIK